MTKTVTLKSTHGYNFKTIVTAANETEIIELMKKMFPVCPVVSIA